MSDGPQIAAVGRDFARYLLGVFAANFFGARYVELIGSQRLLESPAAEVGPVDRGVLVVLDADPEAWDRPERKHADQRMLDHLGREHFFAKPRPPDASRAPDWPA